jgi:Ser/Thr protein kinase RdoA (MazF antagonist)
MKNGDHLAAFKTGEGSRQALLLTYAEGESLVSDEADSLTYGRAAAQLHDALDDFSSQHVRFCIDLDHLLDTPLRAILPILENLPAERTDLLNIVQKLKEHMSNLSIEKLEWGACHGDLHGFNAHITKDRQVISFDFDCGGPGWRAYDIAVFCWRRALLQQDEKLWEAFLRGYTQHRAIGPLDIAAVPLFVALRQIWLIGLHRILDDDDGYSNRCLNKRYFEYHLRFLRKWVNEHIDMVE